MSAPLPLMSTGTPIYRRYVSVVAWFLSGLARYVSAVARCTTSTDVLHRRSVTPSDVFRRSGQGSVVHGCSPVADHDVCRH